MKRCEATNRWGMGCGGPAGHDGQHGAVVRWTGDREPKDVVSVEPGAEMTVTVGGITVPVMVQNVDLQHETDIMDYGGLGTYGKTVMVPGLRSVSLRVDMRSTGEAVRG